MLGRFLCWIGWHDYDRTNPITWVGAFRDGVWYACKRCDWEVRADPTAGNHE